MENVLLVDDKHLALSLNNNKRIRRILELDTDLSKILDKYLSDYEIAHGPLFYNNRNNQIKMRDTERLLQKYIDMVNTPKERIAPFTMQSLRHIAMIMLLKGNVSKENVAKFGGITTKWMNRYEQIVNKNDVDINGRMSIISINPGY